MAREYWRASNLLNPVPCVIISCKDGERENMMTAAWTGTICSDPVMVSVSIRKSRYSHELIKNSSEFVINLVSSSMVEAADYVGIYSGRKVDKFHLEGPLQLTREESKVVKAPSIKQAPVTLECVVKEIIPLGSHDMFIAEVVATGINDEYLDKNNRLNLKKADLVAYCHGEYRSLGKLIGTFGFSSKKPSKKKRRVQSKK